MADKDKDKDKTGELSMENYFNEGLADEAEPNNPFEVLEPEQPKKKKKKAPVRKKSGAKRSRILLVLGLAAALLLVLALVIFVQKRRNDGQRYARKLAEKIGSPIATAQKSAGVALAQQSAFPTLNKLYASYQGITESGKTCRIQGVKLPEWAIFCNTDADELTNVTFYNYEILEKNVFGTERNAYIDTDQISTGSSLSDVETQLDLVPYRIQYLQGKTELREYRYCYEDRDTDEIVSYVITAIWDENGALTNISGIRRNYIGTLLASPEP
jgi:hypothetical protein